MAVLVSFVRRLTANFAAVSHAAFATAERCNFLQAVEKIEKGSAEKADGGMLAGCFRWRVQSLPQRSNWTPSLNSDRATFSIHIKCHPTALLTFPLGHARIHNRLKVKDQIQ